MRQSSLFQKLYQGSILLKRKENNKSLLFMKLEDFKLEIYKKSLTNRKIKNKLPKTI